ncbi:hypothetical protein ABH942_002313 [Flavobacterium sp. 28YEA47A]
MSFFELLTPIRIYILFTFIMLVLNYDKGKKAHVILFIILLLSVINESISAVLKYNEIRFHLNSSIFIVINNILWFLILYHVSSIKKSLLLVAIAFFLSFTLYNLFLLNGTKEFNSYSFVIGAFLYLILFIYNCSSELKKENLNYFLSNNFILMLSPVLFFAGFSLLFGFNNKNIHKIMILGHFKLYDLISYFVNITYYSLINLYIYSEKKLRNVK